MKIYQEETIYPVGTKVKVIKAIDETCLPEQIGKTGEVIELNANGETGNYEDCPLHIVKFSDGSGHDGFWFEELTIL
jgi:hypothetical protein